MLENKNNSSLSGIIVATITPFRNGSVHKAGLVELTDFLTERGVHALFVCGTTGEGMIMNLKERKQVAEIAVERSSKPVVVHAGTNNIEDTVDLCNHAEDIGAFAVAVITPMFYPYTTDGLVSYFVKVSESFEIPMFIYSNPSRTNVKMSPEAFSRIFEEGFSNLIGVKESSGDMTYLGRVLDQLPGKSVFNGADTCFLPALVLGTSGQVSGYANVAPELWIKLYDAWKRRDLEGARKIQTQISKVRALLETPYIQPLKEGLKFRGVDAGDVKTPLTPMSEKEVDTLRKKLADLSPEMFSREKKVAIA
jgi:4-hydroxy-tetrahydrodipicolinate synthase